MQTRLFGALIALCSLAGCSADPKAPSEANFRPVINAKLAKDNPYCEPLLQGGSTGFPPSALASALAAHGLLTPNGRNWFISDGGKKVFPPETITYAMYVLSFSPCVADGAEVATIDNWTEPADLFGTVVTKVSYTYKPSKVSAWVTPDIKALIPQLLETKKKTISLQLTGKGWATESP